jgi:hypothetical protein
MWFKFTIAVLVIGKFLQHALQMFNPHAPRWSKLVRIVVFPELVALCTFAVLSSYPRSADIYLQNTIVMLFLLAVTEFQLDWWLGEGWLTKFLKARAERRNAEPRGDKS